MHHGFTTDIDLLDPWCVSPIGKVFDHAFAKCRAPFGLAEYKVLFAKGLPFDRLHVTERMAIWERHKQALMPERSDVAIGRLARIRYERHIESPLPNQRNVLRRSTLDNVNSHVRMALGIGVYQVSQKAARERRPDANAQLTG
jgi:hypothetical protein